MLSFIKRVTSAVVAGAVVLGSIALYPDAKKTFVNAAETKYDSANLVNYATIMGRAVDYGIVSQSLTQSQHMETTFATFSYARTIDTTTDVDLTNAKTAQFIIGEITSTGDFGTLKFGHVRTSTGQVYVENMRITMSDTMNPRDSFKFQDDVATTTHFNYSYLKRHEIQESIDTVIDHARDESKEMVTRTGDHDYVLDSTDDSLVSVNGAVTTININDERYENKVVYINLDDPKFATLLSNWASEPNGHHLDINKRSSTVIVFTSAKTEPITLGKVSVYAPDSPLYASAPSDGIHDYDYYSSVTTYSGNQSTHNAYVDKEIAQKLIWNITGSKNITISSNAGTFLCLAGDKAHKDVKVTLDGNPCAGWLVVNGNVENKCEYHYIYGGNSEEQQTEGEGQMHFVARKGFATKYADKNGISEYVDNSVDFNAGDYQFFWQEYTDDTFNTPVGEKTTVKIKDTSYVDFPTLSFTADDSSDPHYVTETPKDFYFRITEDPSKSLDGVKNSAGYINIRLRAFVERKGPDRSEIKFRVQSVTMIGENESSLIQYDTNGKWGAEPDREWVDVVNARFDLGAFFNRVKVPGYMTLTKTIEGDVTDADLAGLTFTVTDGEDFTVEYNLGRDFTKNSSGVYELTTPLTVPDSETKYTVTETLYSLDGYKLEEVSYTVDGGETQHDNDTAVLDSVSTDSDKPTTVAYTDSYTPLGNLKVLKTAVDNNNNNINYYYEFTVKNSAGQYLQADKQTFDATEYYFTIGTNEEQTFENIPVGLYTITENTDLFVYGYTFEKDSSKTSGTADVTKKSTVEFKLENKFTQDLGNLEVTKTAKDNNGNAVEGTFKFTISTPMRGFLQADGTFGNEKHYFTISTGQTLTFENLPVDNYMITEDTDSINVTGYTFNMADSKYSVLGKVTKNGNTNVILENDFTQDVGDLKVTKTAKDNHDTNVSGTFEFSVKNSKGQYLQADKQSFGTTRVFFTVDAGSDTTFENLPVGKYTIEENTESISVNGFTFTTEGSKTSVVADVKKGETADAGLLNNFIQDLGSLTVAKVATDNNDKNVNGSFQFSVKNSAGKFLQSDEETFTNTEYFFTVEAGSSKTFTDLPVGEYAISEKTTGVSVPGYTYLVDDSTTKGTGTVSKVTTANSTVTLENKFEQDVGSLTVSKTAKDDNNENVSGSFKFSVKNSAGLYLQSDKKTFDTEVYFFTVAAGSTAVFNNLPVGVYTVTEDANSVAVTGYTFISSSIPEVEAEVEKNESVTAELVNNYEKDVGNLVVSKTAKDNNDKSVAGSFKFSVKNSAGLYLQSDKKTFDTAEYFFTVASGSTAEFNNLPVGVYTVTEDTGSVGVTGYTFESDSTTRVEAEVVKNDSATAELVNNYTQDTGSLTVIKSAVDNYNDTVDGEFKFSVKNSEGKFLQSDEKSFEDEEFFFTVAAGSSKTFENLPVGTYSVNEDTGSVSVTGYTFNENDSKTYAEARVVKDGNADAELENKFTLDLGSLKITKALGEGYPEEARTKAYNFKINGPDDYSEMRTVTGADSVIITGLKPGKYTVTEDTNDAKIEGYDLEVTGGGEVSVVGKAEAATTITNTYTLQTGSLKINKALGDNAPEEAALKTYSFTITGPNNYSKTVSVDGAGYVIVEDLVPGKYTVTENTEDTAIEGYDLEVTGGGEVNVVAKATAITTVTNTYKLQLGSLKITKALGANAPESALTKTYKFMITGPDNYSKTVSVEGAGYVIVSDLVPGSYTVTEVLDGAAIADYDLEVNGGGEVNVVAKDVAGTTITNTYTRQVGSLKITKVLGANAPESAASKSYSFTITGPDNYSKTVSVDGAGYVIIPNLIPGTYTVTEDTDGADIDGYDLEVTGGGEVEVVANAAALTTVTNTYTLQTGSLKIAKALGANAPDDATTKTYTFTITGPDNYSNTVKIKAGESQTVEGLVPGTYTVTEDEEGAEIEGYDLEVTGGGEVSVVAKTVAETTITNTYTMQLGSLKITKALGANAPQAATSKTYIFTVTGPNNYSKTVTIDGAGEEKIDGLVPGTYTVTEDADDAEIEGYDLEVTGGGEVNVVAKDTAETTVTNTYTLQTGSLKITKALGANAPESATSKTYTFTVTGPNNYSKTVTIEGAGEEKIEGLVPGTYTVTEDTDDAEIDGYDLEVTGGGEVNVVAKDTAETTVTNTYTLQTGSLKITKTLGADAPESAKTKSYTFVITGPNEYYKEVAVIGTGSVTVENLVPGSYTVTEVESGAAIADYDLEVTGGGEVSVVAKDVAETSITNTYTKQTGSLTVTKTATDNDNEAVNDTFYFSVKNSEGEYLQSDEKSFGTTEVFFSVISGSSKTFSELPVGEYTVTEDTTRVEVTGYDFLTTSTTEKTVNVTKSATPATAALVNNYEKHLGTLTVQKTAKDNYNDDVTGAFEFSVKNGDNKYLQSDEKTFDDAKYFFTVEAGSSKTFENLPAGKYQVEEKTDDISVSGYTFVLDDSKTSGTGSVSKTSTEHSTVTLENMFIKDVGALKITKALGANAPDGAASKKYTFTVTGPDNFSKTVTIEGAGSETLTDLVPGSYTVTENLTDAAIDGYDLEVTGGGEVTVKVNEVAGTTVTNTYTKQKGSLKITKALGANAPESAKSKSYSFTITGPDNYSKEVAVIGAGSVTVENLVPGSYTVTENESGAAITGYDLEVNGGGEVTVAAMATAETSVTNTYTQQKGSLKITKSLGANAPAGASSKEYTFTVTGPDNYSETVTITGAGSKTLTDLVPGTYKVTENESGAAIDGYDLEVTGGGEVTVTAKATAETTVTNTYTKQTGSLKITKALGEGAPDAANNTEYKFTITGPDNYSKTVTIKGAGSETVENLEPGNYTVTEDKDGAKITNYDLTVTGDDGKTIEVKAGETAEAKITNTYEDNTSSTKGSLKITKKLGANAPQAASSKEYKFTVAGPDNYSKTVTITGAGSVTIDDLEPGNYTVTEDKDGAKIANYELEVTGDDGKAIEVKADETANAEITNTYDDNTMSDKGSLKISKTLGANAPSAASDKSFTFTVTGPDNYSKTVTIKGTGSVTVDELEPGNYTVTENEESAAITNYKLTVTGDNGKTIEVKAGKTSNAAITNTYEDSSLPETGSLKITKALGSGAPSAANSTEYKFNVTGPDDYSKTITIKGAGSFTITGLTPGNYKVTEDKASANITNYDLEVTGGGNVEVKAGEIAESKITNTYKDNSSQVDTGSLTVSKIAVDASENPITGSFKFSVKNSEGKYLQQNEKDFDTSIYLFTINAGDSKKFTGLPVGTYTVEEDISDMSVEGNYELLVSESDISVDGNVTKNGNAEAKLFNYFVDGGVPTPAPTGAVTVTKKVAGNTAGETTSTYSFYVKCGDQYVQDDSTGALGSDKHAFTVDPSSSEGTTITGLALGKTYVIEETSVSAASGFTCATTYTESNTVVLDKENKTGSVKITNTYIDTSKPDDSGNETGILKVTKKVTGSTASSGMPAEYRFTVSFSDGDETLYIQDTAGTTGSEKHEFAVSGNSSVVITGLALDVEYKVEEVKVTGVPSDYTCKTSYTDGGTITLDSSSKTGTVVITNNYSYKAPEPEPTTGSLTITKGLNSGAPSSAKSKTYTFKVTGNGETRTVTIKGANSKTIHDLVPGTYTVSEERDGISINKYSVSVSGEGNVTIEAGKTAKIKITNTYDDITGSLKITKALASGAPDAAQNKTYKFTVTGPDDYSETVEIKGAGSKTLTGLMPGNYKVIENESAAAIDGYNLTVTGDNVSKNVETKSVAYVTITNAYEQKMGTLCFTKTFGGDVTESEANGGDLYFIIENTDTSIEARYLKPDGTFTADKSEAHITLAHLEKTTATNGKFAFKKNFTVPVGNYKVTEENTNVYFRGTSEPITMANSSVTSSVADITDGNTTDVELSDVYELNDNLKVTFNKEDEAHNLIAQAQLTLKSVDGYDLSNVKVTQGGTQVAVTLSADKSSISFYTVDTAPSIVSGLKAGDYELKETVTPPKYKTADAIRFTLYPDGNTKRVGDVTVSGSPIVMIDKADPNYHQGGNNPPIPATGEMTSATTMIGAALMVLAAACFTGLYLFRTKKKKQAE